MKTKERVRRITLELRSFSTAHRSKFQHFLTHPQAPQVYKKNLQWLRSLGLRSSLLLSISHYKLCQPKNVKCFRKPYLINHSDLGLEIWRHRPLHITACAANKYRYMEKYDMFMIRLDLDEMSAKLKNTNVLQNPVINRRSRSKRNLVERLLRTQGEDRHQLHCPIR